MKETVKFIILGICQFIFYLHNHPIVFSNYIGLSHMTWSFSLKRHTRVLKRDNFGKCIKISLVEYGLLHFRQVSMDMQRETQRRQQEEEAWYRQQKLLLDAEDKRRKMIQEEEQKLADQRKR